MKKTLTLMSLLIFCGTAFAEFDYMQCHLIEDVKVAPIQYNGKVLTIPADEDNDAMTVDREYQIQFGDLSYVDEVLIAELWNNLDRFFELSQQQAKAWSNPTAEKPDRAAMISMCEALFAMVDIEDTLHDQYPQYRTIVDVRLRQ